MNFYKYLSDNGLISKDDKCNAIAFPSIRNMKIVIRIDNRKAFIKGLELLGGYSFKSKLAKMFLILIFRFGLLKYVLRNCLVCISEDNKLFDSLRKSYGCSFDVNFYIANAKHQNKSITIQLLAEETYYIRLPVSKIARSHAEVEYRNNLVLAKIKPSIKIPKLEKIIDFQGQSLFSYQGFANSHPVNDFDDKKRLILRQLSSNTYGWLSDNHNFLDMKKKITSILEVENLDLNNVFKSTIVKIQSIKLQKAFSHGDFCSTNVLSSENEVCLIDFEYSLVEFFVAFDLFHYFFKLGKFHCMEIKPKDLDLIVQEVERTYLGVAFKLDDRTSSQDITKYLFIFYLFLVLKRYLLDEQMNIKTKYVSQLVANIRVVSGMVIPPKNNRSQK